MIHSYKPVTPFKSKPLFIQPINSNEQHESAIERFQIMHRQENATYHILNTVSPDCGDILNTISKTIVDIPTCRYKVATWCYDLISFCTMSHETVELAMSLLDRFMFTTSLSTNGNSNNTRLTAWTDANIYQLASMTAFYMAVKVQEPAAFNPDIVAVKLSRGTYTVQQIEQMEIDILEYLQWYVNPPTITAVVREFVTILQPVLMSNVTSRSICTVESFMERKLQTFIAQQIQFCVVDYSMISIPVHIKAYCIILNALEMLNVSDNVLRATGVYLRTLIVKTSTSSTDSTFCSTEESYRIRNILFQAITPEYSVSSVSPYGDAVIDTLHHVPDHKSINCSLSSLRSCTDVMSFDDHSNIGSRHPEGECSSIATISSAEDNICINRNRKCKEDIASRKRKKYSEKNETHLHPCQMIHRPSLVSPIGRSNTKMQI
jgi:Cyclin, N-terminal domain